MIWPKRRRTAEFTGFAAGFCGFRARFQRLDASEVCRIRGSNGSKLHPSTSLEGAVQNTSNPLSCSNSSKLTGVPSQWIPQQFSYQSSALPGSYMMQQFQHDMPQQLPSSFFHSMNQGAGVAGEPTAYGVRASNQLAARTKSHLGSLNSSVPSVGGNPFG